jgi:two-component system sensor histidine kinase UhpB
MKLLAWQSWGIAARLLAIAVLPAALMFVAVALAMYVTAQGDVHRDVSDRGKLVATALAQSSQYGLVSGNTTYLNTTLNQLLRADASILCITIFNDQHRQVAKACQAQQSQEDSVFEVPVSIEALPDLNLFDPLADGADAAPTSAGNPRLATNALRVVGHVRVSMSAAPIFESRRSALFVAFGMVAAAAVLSCLVGLRLAQRLRHTMISVMGALRSIRKGRFDIDLDVTHQGELGELQKTIVQMASTLDAARYDLEQQVIARTAELRDAIERVQLADAEKRRLITHSNARVEEDRKRVAVEIHDHLGAGLISVRLEAAALRAKAEGTGDADMARGAKRISETVESLYASTRDIVKSLRPEVIDTLGLSGAIEEMVSNFDKVHPHCRFAFSADPRLPDMRGERAMPAYRVTQEALTNIVKHAKASHASVELGLTPKGDQLRILIKDNGEGFDTEARRKGCGLGLIGMRERVAAVGGKLVISSKAGQGTSISVILPMPELG